MLRRALRSSVVASYAVRCRHGLACSRRGRRVTAAAAAAAVVSLPSVSSSSLLQQQPCQARRAYGVPSVTTTTTATAAATTMTSCGSSGGMAATATTTATATAAVAAAARVMAAAACPYHRGTTVTAAAAAAVQQDVCTATPVAPCCPVIGTTPPLRCPVEARHGTSVVRTPPTLARMTLVLGKSQLSAYVAATALAGFVLGGGTSVAVALAVTAGTLLQSFSANTANQIIEAPHDARMKRTCRRPLPMRHMTPHTAAALSACELVVGTGVLYSVSPAAAALGVGNWLLYVAMYTPLKRVSALNTWFGSIVGGVPPLMGGAAATGGVLTGPVLLLGSLLFVWQIPHFNGLAFHCRRDYEAAGYRMLAFYNPWRASFYAVAMSVVAAAITLLGPALLDMPVEAAWYYPVAGVANALMVYKSVLFHQAPQLHCRGCFVFSYVYLSIMLAAVMLNHMQPLHQLDKAVTYAMQWQRGSDDSGGDGAATAAAAHGARAQQPAAVACDGDAVPLLPVQ